MLDPKSSICQTSAMSICTLTTCGLRSDYLRLPFRGRSAQWAFLYKYAIMYFIYKWFKIVICIPRCTVHGRVTATVRIYGVRKRRCYIVCVECEWGRYIRIDRLTQFLRKFSYLACGSRAFFKLCAVLCFSNYLLGNYWNMLKLFVLKKYVGIF